MRAPAPPYRGEPRHALWHVSEDDSIRRFDPRDGLVWAVDTRHLPLYWFPRQCPRATFWAGRTTSRADLGAFLRGRRDLRVHVVEPAWLEQMRTTRVVAYRLPSAPFEPVPETGGYWVARETVEPVEMLELGDLVERHADAGIALRSQDALTTLWESVLASSLEYSGIRLRNAR